MKKINENTKITLTIGQIKKLIGESKHYPKFKVGDVIQNKNEDKKSIESIYIVREIASDSYSVEDIYGVGVDVWFRLPAFEDGYLSEKDFKLVFKR